MMGALLFVFVLILAATIEVAFFTLVTLVLCRFIFRGVVAKKQTLYLLTALFVLNGLFGMHSVITDNGKTVPAWYAVMYFVVVISFGTLAARLTQERPTLK